MYICYLKQYSMATLLCNITIAEVIRGVLDILYFSFKFNVPAYFIKSIWKAHSFIAICEIIMLFTMLQFYVQFSLSLNLIRRKCDLYPIFLQTKINIKIYALFYFSKLFIAYLHRLKYVYVTIIIILCTFLRVGLTRKFLILINFL